MRYLRRIMSTIILPAPWLLHTLMFIATLRGTSALLFRPISLLFYQFGVEIGRVYGKSVYLGKQITIKQLVATSASSFYPLSLLFFPLSLDIGAFVIFSLRRRIFLFPFGFTAFLAFLMSRHDGLLLVPLLCFSESFHDLSTSWRFEVVCSSLQADKI